MKRSLILIYVIFASISIFEVNADNGRNETLVIRDNNTTDPRLPFSTYIQYNYSQGVITFSLPPEINYATVSIGADESSETWSGSITRDNPTAQIPALSGLYVITLTADNGAVYFGDIMLE